MKKTFYLFVSFSFLVLLLSGCVATSVGSEPNATAAPDAKISGYQTYAWYQPEKVAPAAYDKGFNGDLDDNLRKAIEQELQRKGMRKVTLKPDVLIAYDVSVEVPKEKDKPGHYIDGFGYGYAHMAGYRYNYYNVNIFGYRSVDLYKQGTLIVDVIKPDTNELLWRGWAEGAITNYNANYKKIHQEVASVLEEFKK